MENIIFSVADSTKSAISKTARAIKQAETDPDAVTALSKLVDSFTQLIEKTKPELGEDNYYSKMERRDLAKLEEMKKQKIRLKPLQ